MSVTIFRWLSVCFVLLYVLSVFSYVKSAPVMEQKRCSKSLSDALKLVCNGVYNEPFSYSGEDNIRPASGPGIVEECCYRACSVAQLETYCKPTS
ncbi:insulin-1-like [Diachasmimorpha longicaudata]|uniref:insulin-1-like n=1 Tax=Diachasmimorpha longicaudata TaxID=58733 RepID=UPI0030B87FC7